ncbi:cysteine desulfurase [Klebsiella pneumoniae subsp. ozaenae]|uniref:Cysteine desulfurase n=1 Tax=Klebsiella pneumoniae subsp. ozaenae TaxID=574 RepID=A0A377ZJK3_KLEPO|nr:cysteine desulfurase [Klebsiella pneumoniae subsp. ozaenae]
MTFSVEQVRADFPVLNREVNGQPLVYLDSAASAQKPEAVIGAEAEFYRHGYAAVHRGIHTLSAEATARMEAVRQQAATFLNAGSAEEVVFVRGTTEGINLVANSWGNANVGAGITSSSAKWSTTPILCRGRCSAPASGLSCG